jgi:hypothetical protein
MKERELGRRRRRWADVYCNCLMTVTSVKSYKNGNEVSGCIKSGRSLNV